MTDWDLAKAARTIVEYVCNVRKGEEVLIYADTAADRTCGVRSCNLTSPSHVAESRG
jgi:hypothetical protein